MERDGDGMERDGTGQDREGLDGMERGCMCCRGTGRHGEGRHVL